MVKLKLVLDKLNYINNSFVNINRISFENYCSKLIKKKVVIDDLIGNNLIEVILNYLIFDFDHNLIIY